MSFAKDLLEAEKNSEIGKVVGSRRTNILLAEIAVSIEGLNNVQRQENSASVHELAGTLFRAGVSSSRQVAEHLLSKYAIQVRE